MAEEPPVTPGEAIGKFAALVAGVVTVFLLLVMLEDKPLGRQFAISVGYTLMCFLYVFFRTALSDSVRHCFPSSWFLERGHA